MLENIEQNKTAGVIQNEIVAKDHGSYSAYDLGYAICDGYGEELERCVSNHQMLLSKNDELKRIFPNNEYCVIVQYATDPLLVTLVRRKYVPWPDLPDPRPQQDVWCYNQATGNIKLLWSLPSAWSMAQLSESCSLSKEDQNRAMWSRWWYRFDGKFWENIRKQHGISLMSEHEIMSINREKGTKPFNEDAPGLDPDTFYLPEVRIKKLEAMANLGLKKTFENRVRQPDALNGNLHL